MSPFPPEHPQRRQLNDEVHARPYELLAVPVRLLHYACLSDDPAAERALLAELCATAGAPAPATDVNFLRLELDGCRLRWERHTEFSSWTLVLPGPFSAPFADSTESPPCAWSERLPGELLVALKLAVEPQGTPARSLVELGALFASNTVAGSRVTDGAAEAWTDYQVHADGHGWILVRDLDLRQRQAGRLVQRLLEMETYRMLALLGLPAARAHSRELANLDGELAELTERINGLREAAEERTLLEALTRLAARVEHVVATTNYRFSATAAYAELIQRNIAQLREQRLPGLQLFAEFTERRLAPAVRTCESVAARLEALSTRVSRASDLLRTRIDIGIAAQNRDLLASMDRRARLQLRLQQTVEGLSIVVLSYYGVGLVGYLAKGLKGAGVPLDSDLVTGVAVPLVIGAVFAGMHRLRKRAGH
ncbi:MAG TPA: DUF3422 domain-containing protein [Gammaproteobacteria bacterium]